MNCLASESHFILVHLLQSPHEELLNTLARSRKFCKGPAEYSEELEIPVEKRTTY